MTTDPANEAREDVQRHWDQAIDVGPETIVRETSSHRPEDRHSVQVCAECRQEWPCSSESGRRAGQDAAKGLRRMVERITGRPLPDAEPETPAATHPAAPSAPQNASGVSEDVGADASVVERAAQELLRFDWETVEGLGELKAAQALADAGLLADPDEVRGLRIRYEGASAEAASAWDEVRRLRDYDRQMRIELAESVPRYERDKAIRERDRARDVAAALEAENAQLSEALRELRESTKHSATQRYIIDRALSGEETK